MNEKEKEAVEFVKKRTEEFKKYAKRENETTYDDIVLNLVDRLLKENEELNNRCRNLDKEAQGYLEELMGDSTLKNRTIKQLNSELEKKDKVIDLLADDLRYYEGMQQDQLFCIDTCEGKMCDEEHCKERIKEYFYKKVE